MLQWQNTRRVALLAALGSVAAAFGTWGWASYTWGW